jgi:hypothetical protein
MIYPRVLKQGIDDSSNVGQGYFIQGHFIIASSQGCSHTEDHIWSCYIFGGINYMQFCRIFHFTSQYPVAEAHYGITPITMLFF